MVKRKKPEPPVRVILTVPESLKNTLRPEDIKVLKLKLQCAVTQVMPDCLLSHNPPVVEEGT